MPLRRDTSDMFELDSGATVALGILSCEHMRSIASAARRCDDALGRVVELAVYNPVDAQALCHAPVELVGRLDYHVLDHAGRWNRVPIGAHARQAIRRAIGGRSHGPLILDHHGQPLIVDRDAIDYAVQLVGELDGYTTEFGWDLESLRLSGLFHLRAAGFSWPTIRRVAGEVTAGSDIIMRSEPEGRRRPCGKRPLPFDPARFVLAHEYVVSLEYVMNSSRFGTTVTVTP